MTNKNKSISDDLKLLCELHAEMERQGPGSPEMTIKALSFLDNLNKNLQVADLGCGTWRANNGSRAKYQLGILLVWIFSLVL